GNSVISQTLASAELFTICEHSQCLTGTALNATLCGAAAPAVCAQDPFCCGFAWDSFCVNEVYSLGKNLSCNIAACAHPLCATGSTLARGCDPNGHVTAVCAIDPFCCNSSWDAICVGEVPGITGKTCDGACAHDVCVEGHGLDALTCDPAVAR